MLISDAYKKEQRRMHENWRYGTASRKFAHLVEDLIRERKPASVLDYGAGKCALREELGDLVNWMVFHEYDPGIKELGKIALDQYDLVVCIDVLEHVEPNCIDDVLANIRAHTKGAAFLTIHTGPAGKTLSDGRNAHLIQQPIEWWAHKLSGLFNRVTLSKHEKTCFALCE